MSCRDFLIFSLLYAILHLESEVNTLNNLIKNQSITVDCPNCKQKLDIKLNQIGSTVLCDNCNYHIELIDDGASEEIEKIDEQLEELEKNLNNFMN